MVKGIVRQVFAFLSKKVEGLDEFGNNGYVVLSGKKYSVGCMSYDEWYLEPYRKGRTERDTFLENTLWERSDLSQILQLFEDNKLLKLVPLYEKTT